MKKLSSRIIFSGLLAVSVAHAEDTAPGLSSLDEGDRQILSKLSPQELQKLNEQFRQVMSLYYDNAYSMALPLLYKISARANTLDVSYWIGATALRGNQPTVAVDRFRTILAKHPEMQRARMDLALALLRTGDKEGAKVELQTVLATNPPENIRKGITEALQSLEGGDKALSAAKPWMVSLHGSAGLLYDSNINAAGLDYTPPGFLNALSTTKARGSAIGFNIGAEHTYDIGDPGEFMWTSRGNYYRLDYFENKESLYDFDQLTLSTGPSYAADGWQLHLPVGVTSRYYGNDPLSFSWTVAPEATYKIDDEWRLRLVYGYENERYSDRINALQDNHTQTLVLGPIWRIPGDVHQQFVSLMGSVAKRDAESQIYSYNEASISPSYFARYQNGLETMVTLRYQQRDYDGNLFSDAPDRKDDRYLFSAMAGVPLSWFGLPVSDEYVVSANVSHVVNKSNTALYEFTKNTIGLNLGVNMNF